MSDAQTSAFGRFVPGFDFLQNLAKGAGDAMPQVPGLSNWIAPTLSVEEIDKRISELRAVQFWLEQNGKALAATVQALEVQKMTLATLQGMDLTFSELAQSMRVRPTAAPPGEPAGVTQAPAADESSEPARPSRRGKGASASRKGDAAGQAGVVDPMQWWTALTQQFQQIAATALQETSSKGPLEAGRNMGAAMAKEGLAAAQPVPRKAASKAAGKSRGSRKAAPAARKSPVRSKAARDSR